MAAPASWPSICRHGLLSASAPLDIVCWTGEGREKIESRHRPESICHPKHGRATIRDRKPMSDKALCKALPGDMKPGAPIRPRPAPP